MDDGSSLAAPLSSQSLDGSVRTSQTPRDESQVIILDAPLGPLLLISFGIAILVFIGVAALEAVVLTRVTGSGIAGSAVDSLAMNLASALAGIVFLTFAIPVLTFGFQALWEIQGSIAFQFAMGFLLSVPVEMAVLKLRKRGTWPEVFRYSLLANAASDVRMYAPTMFVFGAI